MALGVTFILDDEPFDKLSSGFIVYIMYQYDKNEIYNTDISDEPRDTAIGGNRIRVGSIGDLPQTVLVGGVYSLVCKYGGLCSDLDGRRGGQHSQAV